ncbi:guanine methyltransferase Trm5 [Aspergillus egyptiacus]|nr:guanine methyltransferase Trm5 [Aspergillus egyptiacus]
MSPETSSSRGKKCPAGSDIPEMFRPPINRAMRVLDRSFFQKTIPISAATVFKPSDISNVRNQLVKSKDTLTLARLNNIREIKKDDVVRKAILLREEIKHDDTATWPPKVNELVDNGIVEIGPYDLHLDYDYWTHADIMEAILPEDALDEIPTGFSQVGHVAHLNLRDEYIPYRYLIGQVLLDKNPTVRTVIRKTEDVGSTSQFRTFPYEVLAGEHDMNVTHHEQDCVFNFDFSRVYWNSRLETEHRRLVEKFQPGEMVCDVMAGVGPFAIPAGKKRIFVWANDLNPHGFQAMEKGVQRNKVARFVTPFNKDGREFIPFSARALLGARPVTVAIQPKQTKKPEDAKKPETDKKNRRSRSPSPPPILYHRPQTVDHYVMNLPGSAIEFLDTFNGIYTGHEEKFAPHTERKLPMVHVYCFSGHSENEIDDHIDICKRISEKLGHTITVEDRVGGSGNAALELEIHNVRLVSPNKQMFCASFRLPAEVAFRK